jgi:hypothetical protein
MDQSRAPDGSGPLADPPWDVQVTVIHGPRANAPQAQISSAATPPGLRVLLVLVILIAAAGAAYVSGIGGGHVRAPFAAPAADPRSSRPSAVATPFRYPLGCLGASISGRDRVPALRPLKRASSCWRYGIYVTAILHQVHGVWRLALEAVSPSCPVVTLPAAVRAQLAICVRATAPPSA